MHFDPVKVAERPFASTIPNCLSLRPASSAINASATFAGSKPFFRRLRARGPYDVFANACVAIAPTPLLTNGTTAPTLRNFDCTPMPISPVFGSTATIEKVLGFRAYRTLRRVARRMPAAAVVGLFSFVRGLAVLAAVRLTAHRRRYFTVARL